VSRVHEAQSTTIHRCRGWGISITWFVLVVRELGLHS
jgi:hypothetical protein